MHWLPEILKPAFCHHGQLPQPKNCSGWTLFGYLISHNWPSFCRCAFPGPALASSFVQRAIRLNVQQPTLDACSCEVSARPQRREHGWVVLSLRIQSLNARQRAFSFSTFLRQHSLPWIAIRSELKKLGSLLGNGLCMTHAKRQNLKWPSQTWLECPDWPFLNPRREFRPLIWAFEALITSSAVSHEAPLLSKQSDDRIKKSNSTCWHICTNSLYLSMKSRTSTINHAPAEQTDVCVYSV